MDKHSEYKLAKGLSVVCLCFLVISVVMLVMVSSMYFKGNASWVQLVTSVLNIVMFSLIYIQQRNILRKYEKDNQTDSRK